MELEIRGRAEINGEKVKRSRDTGEHRSHLPGSPQTGKGRARGRGSADPSRAIISWQVRWMDLTAQNTDTRRRQTWKGATRQSAASQGDLRLRRGAFTRSGKPTPNSESGRGDLSGSEVWIDEVDDKEGDEIGRGGDEEGNHVAASPLKEMADDFSDEHAADRSGHATDAGDGADGAERELVRGKGIEIGRKTLMASGGESDEESGGPESGDAEGKRNWKNAEGASEHGGFAGEVDGDAAADERGRQPATAHAAEVGNQIDDEDRRAELDEMDAVLALEIVGNPEEIEPPDGVGEEFSGDERPSLTAGNDKRPGDFASGHGGIAANEGQLFGSAARVIFGTAVEQQPEDEPGEAERAGDQKGPAPAEMGGDPRNEERRDHRADAGAGVEDAGGEGAFFFRKPFGDTLDAGGEYAGLEETESGARGHEGGERAGGGVSHGGGAPENHGDAVADARPDAVNQRAHAEHTRGVSELEETDEIAVVDFAPSESVLQGAFEDAENLAIHVIFCDAEEQQRTDNPTEAPGEEAGGSREGTGGGSGCVTGLRGSWRRSVFGSGRLIGHESADIVVGCGKNGERANARTCNLRNAQTGLRPGRRQVAEVSGPCGTNA